MHFAKGLMLGALALSVAAQAADTAGGSMSSSMSISGPMSNSMAMSKVTAADAKLIASAESAAPKAVAMGATIVAMEAGGKTRVLRRGTNGFTCMPDDPSTPGPDSMCFDKASGAWIEAMMKHKAPPAGKVGFMYMLAGGTDASNTDPFAAKPTGANHWIKTGPHVMIVGGDAAFYDTYPKSADPDTKSPYVMWAGTPYQHLMVPVK
jgi:hypothetical protein